MTSRIQGLKHESKYIIWRFKKTGQFPNICIQIRDLLNLTLAEIDAR